jgi:1,4-dihydroxy-2-naphthoate polyprenyltransferase
MEQIEKRNPVRAWVMASRPRTLTASIVPVIVGTALAVRDGVFNMWVALAALLAAVLIQIGTNLANDLHDFKKGADTDTRLGPTRVTSAGLLTPREVESGMWVVFGLAAACGLYVVYVGGWPILVIGITSILAGIAYTAGPFPLGYNGLGDVAVFIFFGLAGVMGTYYAQARAVTLDAFVTAVPVGALTTNILVVNNVRDTDTDRAAGKRTLAVLWGRGAARAEYAVLLALAYGAPLVLWLLRGARVWVLLPLLTIPVAVRLARVVITTEGPALNRALAETAQFLAFYGLLFALGLAL